jgi:hypothetical protein
LLFIPRRCRFADFSVSSSAAKKRDSNLLFASSSSIFENFFSQYSAILLFSTAFKPIAFAFGRQQQRGEILICFRNIVKYFSKNSSEPFSTRRPSQARQ